MAVKELNYRIGEIRNDCNLTLSELARLTGTSRQTICNYEKDKYKPNMAFYIKFFKVVRKIKPILNFMYLIDSECEDKFAVNQETMVEFGLNDKSLKNLKELSLVNRKYDLTSSSKKPKLLPAYNSTVNLLLGNDYFVQFIMNLNKLLNNKNSYDSEYFSWLISKEINKITETMLSNQEK